MTPLNLKAQCALSASLSNNLQIITTPIPSSTHLYMGLPVLYLAGYIPDILAGGVEGAVCCSHHVFGPHQTPSTPLGPQARPEQQSNLEVQ